MMSVSVLTKAQGPACVCECISSPPISDCDSEQTVCMSLSRHRPDWATQKQVDVRRRHLRGDIGVYLAELSAQRTWLKYKVDNRLTLTTAVFVSLQSGCCLQRQEAARVSRPPLAGILIQK